MMLFADHIVVVLGGGDLGTGAVARLSRAGFPVVVLEIDPPLTVRRPVAVSTAVTEGRVEVEDLVAKLVDSVDGALEVAATGEIAVLVDSSPQALAGRMEVLVDARVAKRNIDTTIDQAPLVIGLGPGFTAEVDCHAVVETMRGHHIGRVIWAGTAEPNTGVPGRLGGEDEQRVLRAEHSGPVEWLVEFGERVMRDQAIGTVAGHPVRALTHGVVRGMVAPGFIARPGLKLGDIDPRADASMCFQISDKSLAVGGGVLEAVLMHLNRSA